MIIGFKEESVDVYQRDGKSFYRSTLTGDEYEFKGSLKDWDKIDNQLADETNHHAI